MKDEDIMELCKNYVRLTLLAFHSADTETIFNYDNERVMIHLILNEIIAEAKGIKSRVKKACYGSKRLNRILGNLRVSCTVDYAPYEGNFVRFYKDIIKRESKRIFEVVKNEMENKENE